MQRSRCLLSIGLLLFVFVSIFWSFLLKHWDWREKWKEERSQLLYEAIQNAQRMFKPLCPPNSYLVLVLGTAKDSVKRWRAGSLLLRIGSLTEACLLWRMFMISPKILTLDALLPFQSPQPVAGLMTHDWALKYCTLFFVSLINSINKALIFP